MMLAKKDSHRDAYATLANSIQSIHFGQNCSSHAPSFSPDHTALLLIDQNILGPLDQVQYPNVQFWKKVDWHNNKLHDTTRLNNKANSHGRTKVANSENSTLEYVEDANGQRVDSYRVTQIRQLTREIWMHLCDHGVAPKTWMKSSLPVHSYFHSEMYKRFPELHLCENHWKVDQIAISGYSGWYRNNVSKSEDTHTLKHEDINIEDIENIPLADSSQKCPMEQTPRPKKLKIPRM
jgi:hypothetical protein